VKLIPTVDPFHFVTPDIEVTYSSIKAVDKYTLNVHLVCLKWRVL